MSKIQQAVRGDGLKIITKRLPYTNLVRITISVMAGSACDPKDKQGLFHFFEHMAYQGTRTRTAKEIAAFLDRYTKDNNAGTGRLSVQYYGVSVKFNQYKLLEILSDAFLNSIFPEEEFQKERGAIAVEIAEYADKDDHVAVQNLTRLLYKNNPARESGLGTIKDLKKIKRDTLLKAHQEFYVPSKTVIIATGNILHDDIVEKVDSLFPKGLFLSNEVGFEMPSNESSLPINGTEMVIGKPQKKTSVICMGVKLPDLNPKEWLTAEILSGLLGGGESSLLHSELRQKRGLVYGAGAGIRDTKPLYQYFVFAASTLPSNMEKVRRLMKEIVIGYTLDPLAFLEMKEKYREEAYVEMETASQWNSGIMNRVESGKDPLTLDGYSRMISKILDSISIEDVVKMREKFITKERLATSIVTAS